MRIMSRASGNNFIIFERKFWRDQTRFHLRGKQINF